MQRVVLYPAVRLPKYNAALDPATHMKRNTTRWAAVLRIGAVPTSNDIAPDLVETKQCSIEGCVIRPDVDQTWTELALWWPE